jgi:hypothetical protein
LYRNFFSWIFVYNECGYAVILEDDIFPGADAVAYFRWGRHVMGADSAVLSVSGSNDNADERLTLHPSVVVRAEQLLGLGWLTSARFNTPFFQRIDTASSIPWDKQLNDMMNAAGVTSVFPHLPRTVHMPWSDGRNGELVRLCLSTMPNVDYVPVHIFMDYTGRYLDWVKSMAGTEERTYKSTTEFRMAPVTAIKYPFSHLAGRPFGYYAGVALFPSVDGKVVVARV